MRENPVGHAQHRFLSRGFTLNMRGFTLIEICIVLVIASLALTAGVNVLKQYRAQQVIKTNNERIETIKKAMAGYMGKHNKAPCAAPRNLPPTSPTYGRATDCTVPAVVPGTVTVPGGVVPANTVRIGAVPVRDLGLSNAYLTDAYGNLFTYAVTEAQTVAPMNPNAGGIDIIKDPAAPAVSEVTPAGSVIYTVISPGKTARGAWSAEGRLLSACPATAVTHDDWNCQTAKAQFVSAPFSTATGAMQHFDDQVTYSNTVNTLKLPECGANQVLSSNDGIDFFCKDIPPPEDCDPDERLTSTDGINFTCLQLPQPPVCNVPSAVLTSTTGTSFSCPPLPDPPPTPTPNPTPPACLAGQVLTSDGTNFSCKTPVVESVQKFCDATGWMWGTARWCYAACPAGYTVTGGGIDAADVVSDKGHLAIKGSATNSTLNGYSCYVNVDWCDSGGAQPCGLRCFATCSRIR